MPDTITPAAPAATPPSPGNVSQGESAASLDQVNIWMRSSPWYQELMKSWGQDPAHPGNLSDSQRTQIVRGAQAQGVKVDESHMEVDPNGNFRPIGHGLRNTLIVAGLAAATIATMGAAGAFSGAAAGGIEGSATTGLATGAGLPGAVAAGTGDLAALGGGAAAAAGGAGAATAGDFATNAAGEFTGASTVGGAPLGAAGDSIGALGGGASTAAAGGSSLLSKGLTNPNVLSAIIGAAGGAFSSIGQAKQDAANRQFQGESNQIAANQNYATQDASNAVNAANANPLGASQNFVARNRLLSAILPSLQNVNFSPGDPKVAAAMGSYSGGLRLPTGGLDPSMINASFGDNATLESLADQQKNTAAINPNASQPNLQNFGYTADQTDPLTQSVGAYQAGAKTNQQNYRNSISQALNSQTGTSDNPITPSTPLMQAVLNPTLKKAGLNG